MEDMTIVIGVYRPTDNWGAPLCRMLGNIGTILEICWSWWFCHFTNGKFTMWGNYWEYVFTFCEGPVQANPSQRVWSPANMIKHGEHYQFMCCFPVSIRCSILEMPFSILTLEMMNTTDHEDDSASAVVFLRKSLFLWGSKERWWWRM
jgi:hypothetical protein